MERVLASEHFRLAIEAAPNGMLMIDGHGTILLVNAHVERLFGYPRDELIGRSVEVLVPDRSRGGHPHHRASFLRDPQTRPMGAGRDLHGRRKDGSEVPIEIGLNPLRLGDTDFVLSSIVDITERKRSERALRELNAELEDRVRARTADLTSTLREREVLLQEVHHRVKNNLQVISSLINMHLRSLEQGAGRRALEECQNRVRAIALIHEKLYQSQDYARVPFSDYARSLAGYVFQATGVSPASVELTVDVDRMSLPVDKAIPCGLILNELITNALKHAFPGGARGTLRVGLRHVFESELALEVADDGIGLPAELDPARVSTLGVRLVVMLVEQLHGRLEVVRGPGTTFRIQFPAEGAR